MPPSAVRKHAGSTSKKAPIERWAAKRVPPSARARTGGGARQEGTLWRQKMQSLALRLSKRRLRRHASGAPMKHGQWDQRRRP
ncbi:MAG: hypothetical protein HYT90_00750 [Candidatus Omnitrophica bacterium]|nr:hypothetical protein [Candidatus Omnitrophota bacterium]